MELNQFRDVDLVIDKANDNFIQRQFVSQGDYKGRTMTVQVTDNGLIGKVPGLMLNLRWLNQASGLADLSAFECIDDENSVFRIEYPEQMMTPGKVVANIQVIQNGQATHLKTFEMTVQALAGEMTGIVDKAEYGALVAVLADANKFRTDIDTLEIDKADKIELEKTESNVADLVLSKMDKDTTNISISQINKNKGKIDQTYLTEELLKQIAGNAPINATPADKSITTNKMADGAITGAVVADSGIVSGKIAKDAVQKNNVAPVAIKATNTDFLKFDGIDVFDPSLNESGAIYPATGLDWAVSGYTRSGYLPVAGAKFLKIVDPTVTLNDSHAFFYDAQKQFLSHVDLRGDNSDIYLFNDGVRRIFVLPVPENAMYYRMWLKSTAYDLTTNCQIRIYSEFGSQNNKDNTATLSETLGETFLKESDVEISVNLYDPKKSEVGGLNPDGSSKSANIEGAQGYSRSGFIALNGGENADGMMFEWFREGLTSTNLDFTFVYKSGIDLSECATVASIGGTVENGVMRFTIPNESDYRYLRVIDKNPNITEEIAAKQTVKRVLEKDDVTIKGKSLSDIFRRKDEPAGSHFLKRPTNGVVNFTVPINTSMIYQETEDTLSIQDDESWDVDDAVLFLPINYDPDGEAVPFVVNCHGAGTTITSSTTALSQPVPNLINLGYAVLDVNGVPKALSNNSGLHYGSPLALQSYLKAYDYVIKRYNVKKDVFVVGTSMGGLTSNMLVQSGSMPVIAQASLCGVTDHFKQAYCNPWNAPDTQRSQIAKLFGFTGTEPAWTTSKYPNQAEIDYYMDNLDKVVGYNPMLKNTINWQAVDPYSYPNQTVEDQTAEAAEYQKLIKIHRVPLKIWHNDNDTTVSPRYSEFYVNAIRNAGGLAYLRKFPSGAHNAWDNGETITIKNISGADMIVTATTYELNLWLKRFL